MNSSYKDLSKPIMFQSLIKKRRFLENSSDSNNFSSNNQDQNNFSKSFVRSDSAAFKSVLLPESLKFQGYMKLGFAKEVQVSNFQMDINKEKLNSLLDEVKQILIKVFNNDQEKNNQNLNLINTQTKILETIIKKKIKKKQHNNIYFFRENNLTIKQIQDFLQQNLKHKKPEQYTKYFIHKFLKYLKKKMNSKNRKNKIKKKTKDQRFLNYYFKDASLKHKIPLHYFQDPYLKKNKHPYDKCFIANTTYFGRLLLSQKVRNEIDQFLNKELIQIAQDDTISKLDNIFKKLSKKSTYYFNQQFEKDVLNPSFKLPWNQYELIKAIDSIKEVIEKSKKLKSLN